jgi:protein TonB
MTKLLTHAALVASLTAVSQVPGDLKKSLGRDRRICATVGGYEFVHPSAHNGDCSVKLDLAGPEKKPQFYVLLPKDALDAFPAKPEESYVTRQVCVTGTVEADSKRVLHTVARTPAQIELIDSPGAPFGAEAHRLCEAGIERPVLVREVKPSYPSADFIRKKIEDVVFLEAVVGADGRVMDARPTYGRYPQLNASAMTALKQWRFAPAKLAGEAVAVIVQVEITFTLR